VWDTGGRLITFLVNGYMPAGSHRVTFDGSELASGIYIVRMQAGDYTAARKIVLLK
jgi:hypothetical protein